MALPTTVVPFILPGVTLAGVNSLVCPTPQRLEAWARLAEHLDQTKLDAMTTEVPPTAVIATAPRLLEGAVRGRIVVPIASELGKAKASGQCVYRNILGERVSLALYIVVSCKGGRVLATTSGSCQHSAPKRFWQCNAGGLA